MKNLLYILFLSANLLLSGLLFTACSDDPHDPDFELSGDISGYFPEYSIVLNCSYSTQNQNVHLEAEPTIQIDLEKWNLQLERIDYYVDDVFCGSQTEAPYKLIYESSTWTHGTHVVEGIAIISGNNVETVHFPFRKVIQH